jgi:hypothetical protein
MWKQVAAHTILSIIQGKAIVSLEWKLRRCSLHPPLRDPFKLGARVHILSHVLQINFIGFAVTSFQS